MGFNSHLAEYAFARSLPRTLDDETIIDLLSLIEVAVERSAQLEDAGFEDKLGLTDALYQYILDALGFPLEGQRFGDQIFERLYLEEMFYLEYMNTANWPTPQAFLATLRSEYYDLKGLLAL
ncbi:MAG: hypothetical protein GY814_15515 [Gammaproteobacteria bacterium]|nr:hypothetical protein [Gammaproteobacteria bacterium]